MEGSYEGSYLTVTSKESVYFGIIHVLTDFGVVFLDTGFWQKGSAAEVAAAVPGYILGGNAYFAVPFAFGIILGLGALALEQTPAFPTYPRRMTAAEVSSGLVVPYTSQAIAGKGGAGAVLVIVFMACTSITSAQLIAMSSIYSFDVYKTYINKKATNAQIILHSHIGVVGSWLVVSSVATAFHQGGVDLNWLLYMLGELMTSRILRYSKLSVSLQEFSFATRFPNDVRAGVEEANSTCRDHLSIGWHGGRCRSLGQRRPEHVRLS